MRMFIDANALDLPQDTPDARVFKAVHLAMQYGGIDGGHHKQWVIDQMVRLITGEQYPEWVKAHNNPDGTGVNEYEWDEGIIP